MPSFKSAAELLVVSRAEKISRTSACPRVAAPTPSLRQCQRISVFKNRLYVPLAFRLARASHDLK
jgi:hypothetical protein